MSERTWRLELVRALTPHRHAPAAEWPKIRRPKKSKCRSTLKLSRFDNSFAHLLRCQRNKFGNRRASLQHRKIAFATDLPKTHSRHQSRQRACPEVRPACAPLWQPGPSRRRIRTNRSRDFPGIDKGRFWFSGLQTVFESERKNTVPGTVWRRGELPNHPLRHVQFGKFASQCEHIDDGLKTLIWLQHFG